MMEKEENRLLSERSLIRDRFTHITPLTILVLSLVAIGVVGLSYYNLRKEMILRRAADKILRQKNIDLEQSNTELASFTYIASHDLQEPLRKIQTFADRILNTEEDSLSENVVNNLNRITASAERLKALIKDLLAYSWVSKQELPKTMLDLNRVVATVIQEQDEEITQKSGTVNYTNLPSITANEQQFGQLFTNLISNSLKYSREEVPLVININSEPVTRRSINLPLPGSGELFWAISVADNGIGFESRFATKIFDLFQRLHDKNEYSGTGIGLAICNKIVQNHQGLILAEGQPGEGSTFTIYLPRND